MAEPKSSPQPQLQTRSLSPSEHGRRAARARWGPPRVVVLERLSPATREVILTLVYADEAQRRTDGS